MVLQLARALAGYTFVLRAGGQICIVSRWQRFADLLGRNDASRRGYRFGRLRPGVQDINNFALIAQDFRANLLAHSFRINASKPKWSGMKHQRRHDLWAAVSLD